MGWGGARPGAGKKKSNPDARPRRDAQPRVVRPAVKVPPKVTETAATPDPLHDMARNIAAGIDPRAMMEMLPEIEAISKRYAKNKYRNPENNPFRFPTFPKAALPPEKSQMAMDSALTEAMNFGNAGWLGADAGNGIAGEGLLFLGYSYLAELAQRPEYRVMAETIADDATRKWIDFDVVGDEKTQKEEREKDPKGYDERIADPDERKKRVTDAGKLDRIKALKDDQLRLEVKDRFYEQCRNDGFFGRSHLFLDIHTEGQPDNAELGSPIGNGRDAMSKGKVPQGSFKALRTIEPVWTYPLSYNATDPLRSDWYNPQVWFVMGREINGERLLTFIGHPVPDMLKPAYAFGGLSLTQMAKPYVDIWLQTRQSVADLIHSFSVMVLMTDLSTIIQPGNVGALLTRAAMFNMLRDNNGLYVVNKNTEDFKNVSASLSGLHELQAQSQEHMASVHRIPLVKFTGIQPSGLNASSEGEIKVYDDTIMAYQSRFMAPNLTRVINFEQLSLFGEVDPEITFRFAPLREMTQAEKGQKEKDDAERNQKYVDMGAIAPGEVRKIIIEDPDLPFTGLDPDDVPDLMSEEMGGLEPPGGHPQEKPAGDPDDKGGEANDAAVPFGANDAGWNEADHPRAPDGKFGSEGREGSKEQDKPRGKYRSSDDVKTTNDLEKFSNVSLPEDDENFEYFYHSARYPSEIEKIANEGVKGSAWFSKDEIRDRGAGFVIVRAPRGQMSEGKDRVEPGLSYREFKASDPVPAENVLRVVRSVPTGGGHSIREDHLAKYASSNQGLKDKDVKDLPEKYQKWFDLGGLGEDVAKDEARFEESKHPRDDDGKFASGGGGGGGSGASEAPEQNTFKTKKDQMGHLLTKGTTPKEVMAALGWPSVSMPQQAASLYMKLEKYKEGGVTKYRGIPMTDAEKSEAKAAALAKRKAKNPGAGNGLRGRAAADPKTWSLFEFLASKGGLKPTADLHSIFGSKRGPFVPGFGPLLRPGGIPMDEALTLAKENAYVIDPNDIQHVPGAIGGGENGKRENTIRVNDLQDMIAEESRGKKQYRTDHAAPESEVDTHEEARHIVDALHREMTATGGTVDPALEDRVVQIIQKEGERDVLAAYERAIMEDHDKYEASRDDRQAAGYESEDWDVYPDSASEYGDPPPDEWGEAGVPF